MSFVQTPAFAVPAFGHRAVGEVAASPAVVRGGRLASVALVDGVALILCLEILGGELARTDEVTAVNDCRRLVAHSFSRCLRT